MSAIPTLCITPELSIILPALTMNADYLRCVTSIRAALLGKVNYEIISVVRDINSFSGLTHPEIRVFSESGPGIYRAMNLGLERASGQYIYFIGQDDILLPCSASAIRHGMAKEADIILGNVFWGNSRIHRNHAIKHSLVWTNWCHQGVFYRRSTFLEKVNSFPIEYKAQADHYSNIVLSTAHAVSIVKYRGCVAWYSATGFSTQWPDLVFRAAFPGIVRKHFGLFSYGTVKFRRAILACFRFIWKASS